MVESHTEMQPRARRAAVRFADIDAYTFATQNETSDDI